jgi:TolB-like protein
VNIGEARVARQRIVLTLAIVALLGGITVIARRRGRPGDQAAGTAPDDAPSILVPPFRTVHAADRDSLGSGLARNVEGALTRLQGLAVQSWVRDPHTVPRSSSGPPTEDAAAVDLGRRLRSTYVLVGVVEHQDARTAIAVRLLRARDGTAVWSGTYWRDTTALTTFPSELAAAVAEALHLPSERRD